ncbi:hypothetical protein JW926_13715, partial [Candidatus Sumerlaeota bacterium]|nr:hypothetical protein [Candidatus Sumerlaeota bacterium]
MTNEETIIDCVERLKKYLFNLDPEFEIQADKLRHGVISPQSRSNFPDVMKESLVAVHLNEDCYDTPTGKRQIRRILSGIRNVERESASESSEFTISERKMGYIREGLRQLDELMKRKNLEAQIDAWIRKSQGKSNLNKVLGLNTEQAYRFLSLAGYPVAPGSSRKYRFLARLGWINRCRNSATALHEYHLFCENAARFTGESVRSLDLLFSLFSRKTKRRTHPLPVCGTTPRCHECPLSHYCDHYRLSDRKMTVESRKTMHSLPMEDRPREKLENAGASRLSDSDLLAIILGTGMRNRNAVDLAGEIIRKYKSFHELGEAPFSELCRIKGIGRVKAIQIQAALEMGRRSFQKKSKSDMIILESRDVFNKYRNKLYDLKQESFFLLILNSRNQVIKDVEISRGTLDGSMAHPRDVFREAIR